MLRGLGVMCIVAGLCALAVPGFIPFVPHSVTYTSIRAGGAGVILIGAFLWWPARD